VLGEPAVDETQQVERLPDDGAARGVYPVPTQLQGRLVSGRDHVFDAYSDVGVIVDGLDDFSDSMAAADLALAEALMVDVVLSDGAVDGM
jgi:hypothetical protein